MSERLLASSAPTKPLRRASKTSRRAARFTFVSVRQGCPWTPYIPAAARVSGHSLTKQRAVQRSRIASACVWCGNRVENHLLSSNCDSVRPCRSSPSAVAVVQVRSLAYKVRHVPRQNYVNNATTLRQIIGKLHPKAGLCAICGCPQRARAETAEHKEESTLSIPQFQPL